MKHLVINKELLLTEEKIPGTGDIYWKHCV
jgi:hypothetical protein